MEADGAPPVLNGLGEASGDDVGDNAAACACACELGDEVVLVLKNGLRENLEVDEAEFR